MSERNVPVMIVSVDDDLDGLKAETEKLTSKVQWVTVSPEVLERIVAFVRDPSTGVRRERPKRKEEPSGELEREAEGSV
jgi:hypothetical protein